MLASVLSAAPKKDIVDTAVEAGIFKTLVAAVKAAGLVDTLKGEGPFTVFAPTDEAFAKLPKGTVETLLKPENKQKLVDILTYHVVSGKVKAKKAAKLDSAKTVNGSEITIKPTGKTLMDRQNKQNLDDKQIQSGQARHQDLKRNHSRHRCSIDPCYEKSCRKHQPHHQASHPQRGTHVQLWSSRSSSSIVHESRQGCSRPMFFFSLPGSQQNHQNCPSQSFVREMPDFTGLDYEKSF